MSFSCGFIHGKATSVNQVSLMFSGSISLASIDTDTLSMVSWPKIGGRSSTTLSRFIAEVPTFWTVMVVPTESFV